MRSTPQKSASYIRCAVQVPEHKAARHVPDPDVPVRTPEPTARFIHAQDRAPARADWFRKLKSAATKPREAAFVASERHTVETNYYVYRRQLKRLTAGFGRELAKLEANAPLPAHMASKPAWFKSEVKSPQRSPTVPAE